MSRRIGESGERKHLRETGKTREIALPRAVDVQATVDRSGISRGSIGSRAATDYLHRHFSVAKPAILQPAVLSHLPSQRRGFISVELVIGIRH